MSGVPFYLFRFAYTFFLVARFCHLYDFIYSFWIVLFILECGYHVVGV